MVKNRFKVVGLPGKLGGGSIEVEARELAKVDAEIELVEAKCTTEDELIAVAKDADSVLGGIRILSHRVLDALPKCRIVAAYSVGYDAIDVDAIILSKTDIDEKGGAAVSVSYVTKKPIIYIGVGQEYKDLAEFDDSIIMENLGLSA